MRISQYVYNKYIYCWSTKQFCIIFHMEQNCVEKLCYYRSITVENYPGFSSVELTFSYIKLLNWRALYYSEDPNMERLLFNYSTKNTVTPVTPKSEYIRQLIDKTEQFLCRMRWKAYHFINPNQKSGKDTFGFKTRNNPPVIEELKEFEDGMTKSSNRSTLRLSSVIFRKTSMKTSHICL